MRRLLALCLVLSPALAPSPANAEGDQCCVNCLPKLMNAQMVDELRSFNSNAPGCTTYVGYNPAYASSNKWSIGVGNRKPRGAFGPGKGDIPPVPDSDTGYWEWDHPVQGDSLQGWWPVRHRYECTGGCEIPDAQRPWWAIDIGNQVNYVINQGPGHRRTLGVVGVWHVDPGPVMAAPLPGTNPVPPAWLPIAGARSAWCGLRAHGDVTVTDPITGNAFSVAAMEHTRQNAGSPGGTDRKYPGYASQWDQMLYRDVDVSGVPPGGVITLGFSVATHMSTGFSKDPGTRAGWFEWDPLAVVAGNYIPAATPPIDRFSVYIGKPVDPVAPAPDFLGSDGVMHEIFDPMRRWFSEVLDITAPGPGGTFVELMSLTGINPAGPVVIPIPAAVRAAMGPKLRIVFRVKTNRGFDDDDGSRCGYSSGGMGAAQIDNVTINLGPGPVLIGDFESANSIDNSLSVSALNAWKSTGKPPGIYPHLHELSDLLYQDVCGPPGVLSRRCNLAGNLISAADHDLGESANGPFGTAEQDRVDAIFSPTINLATIPGSPEAPNAMGIKGSMFAQFEDFHITYDSYTGDYDLPQVGNAWQFLFQSYPATQSDGVRCWGEYRVPDFLYYNPARQCVEFSDPARMWGLIRTSNVSGIPDSLRIGLRKVGQCFRFGIDTKCGSTLGAYWDNVSLAIVRCDQNPAGPVSVDIWHWIQDTFPADETAPVPLPGFFQKAAKIETGLNTAPGTCSSAAPRCDDPGDFPIVTAEGPDVRVDMVFRILPGPGNYKIPGDVCSGLRRSPTDTTRISSGDNSFWTEYILSPGSGFPTNGPCKGGGLLRHDQRWSELAWCKARCDTAECYCTLFPVQGNGVGCGPQIGRFSATYHEADPKFATLGIPKNRCFLVNPNGPNDFCKRIPTNVVCGDPPPAWVPISGTGYNGSPTTRECTKIIPNDLLTPGAHVEYYFERTEIGTGFFADVPDPSRIIPQWGEGPSTDAHRWQQFSVLPDAWKEASFGGLGRACMLYVDWADRRGNEPVWDDVADGISASGPAKHGSHNGWQAPDKAANPNDPAWFVNKNQQPGTTWDMYGVKAAESLNASSGSLGARLALRPPQVFEPCEARNAPTLAMLNAFYRVLLIHSGDIGRMIISPFIDRSQDDFAILHDFLFGGTESSHRGLWVEGEGFAAAADAADAGGNAALLGLLNASVREDTYHRFSGNHHACIDLIPTNIITTNGDIYGLRNACVQSHDVMNPEGDGVAASYYDPVGANPVFAPYVSGVFTDAGPTDDPTRHFQTLLDGWDVENQLSRLCDKPYGRLVYYWNVLTNVFGKICSIAGSPLQTTEVPSNDDGTLFVNLARLGENPVLHESAVIHLTLAQADWVTVRIHDVSGRLVRTLADRQRFGAGRVDPALTWDGLDDRGRKVPRGAYFVSVRYENSRYGASHKMILLR